MRFDRDGEELLAAHMDGVLVAIGGLALDPLVPGAMRMRRFDVRPSFRRHGIGRSLVEGLLEHPRRTGHIVVVNAARGSSASGTRLALCRTCVTGTRMSSDCHLRQPRDVPGLSR